MSKFIHTHHAHCESGVVSSLLRHHGLNLSEPMVFGLSGALNFAYIPFVKIGGMPLVAYRSVPKAIIKNIKKTLHVDMKMQTFSSVKKGEDALDELLKQGYVVGAQSSVYWLEYFPPEMRFHFNAHNLIIYDKDGDNYLISDPVFDKAVTCSRASLSKARFVKGAMAPKGLLYYVVDVPKDIDLKPIVKKNIKKTAKFMLKTPVPIAGLRAMKYLAKHIRKLKQKDKKYAKLFLGHIVRMQEEIGTGGAGFRFMYASFLQEASKIFDDDKTLQKASEMMLKVGDSFREFALLIAKSLKSKDIDFDTIANKLIEISKSEKEVYKEMLRFR